MISRGLLCVAFLILAVSGQAQVLTIPQIADGADWRTEIVVTNTTTSFAIASLTFYNNANTGWVTQAGSLPTPWNPPFLESINPQSFGIPAGGSVYLHTPGTAATLSQGWALVSGAGVSAYAIYTYGSYAGRPDQDGTSQATQAVSRILVPFDNTNGFITSMAIVNPNPTAETVAANIQTDNSTITGLSLPLLGPYAQAAFLTGEQIPATAGQRGVAEFYVSSGTISIAAFRFNPTLALTSSPVYLEAGPPIIGNSQAVTLPFIANVNNIAISATMSNQSSIHIWVGQPASLGVYSLGMLSGGFVTANTMFSTNYAVQWNSVTFSGQTLTFSGLLTNNSLIYNNANEVSPIQSATLTVTLTPANNAATGSVIGSLSVVSSSTIVGGSFTGTYGAR